MWKNRGVWVAVAVIGIASVLLVTAAFAEGDGRPGKKGKSCCSDRQIAVAERIGSQTADKVPCSVADKGDSCKSLKKNKTFELCTHCGHLKGSEKCCSKGLVKCDKCGLAKGSPGCCKIPAGMKKAELCGKCGQIKGTDECCAKDMKKCDKCGMAVGSPGCCLKGDHVCVPGCKDDCKKGDASKKDSDKG
jgi:hypothetical protein